MAYSSDFRKCVLAFIEAGGKKTQACRQFSIARATLYTWLNAEDALVRQKPGPRGPRTLDRQALEKHVADFPDQTQAERASHFGVSEFCVYYGLKTLGITRKKTLGYKERCPKKRSAYRQELATLQQTGKSIVYADESGFRDENHRRYGYARKGAAVYGLISSQRTRTKTLLAARFQGTFRAARLLQGGCKSADFNDWLAEELCPHLTPNHVRILDNAMLQKTVRTRQLVERTGASLLFLPPYSPDYNPIEHDLVSNIKRKREYNPDSTLDDIIQEYENV